MNNLVGLEVDGRWEERPREIKKEVKTFFENRFMKIEDLGANFDGVPFKTISEVDNETLYAKFDPLEVKEAFWECEGDKIPGSDDFNFHFIKAFWHILAGDVQRVLDEFHSHGVWPT